MGRLLTSFWVTTLLLSITTPAVAKHDSEDWVRRLSKAPKHLVLTSTREETPVYKMTPKLISFKGEVKIPSYMRLTKGSPKVHGSAGQLIIDDQVICNYSPRSNKDSYYVLKECSDGSRSGDKIEVKNKIELKLNYAASDKAALTAQVPVVRSDVIDYGIVFPYLRAEEGQILMYNGEAWVAADVTELGLSGIKGDKGDKGDQGEVGPQGPAGATGAQGPAGATGAQGSIGATGAQGPAGATGAKGDAGVAGAQGPAGATGAQGPAGADGATGVAGVKGDKGDRGDTGSTGAQGPVGAIGPIGLTGATGATGAQGPAGADGAKGDKGDEGDQGLSEIAYLRDEKASGVQGGACLANVWSTRALNVLGGDTNFISLNANRFVLQPGKYFIEISAPAYQGSAHKAKLKVIETNLDILIGSTAFSNTTSPSLSHSIISGEIVVTEISSFEIQHRCGTDRTIFGLGIAANFGTVEVYTQVKIIKKE